MSRCAGRGASKQCTAAIACVGLVVTCSFISVLAYYGTVIGLGGWIESSSRSSYQETTCNVTKRDVQCYYVPGPSASYEACNVVWTVRYQAFPLSQIFISNITQKDLISRPIPAPANSSAPCWFEKGNPTNVAWSFVFSENMRMVFIISVTVLALLVLGCVGSFVLIHRLRSEPDYDDQLMEEGREPPLKVSPINS